MLGSLAHSDPTRDSTIAKARAAGESVALIASRLECSRQLVYNRLVAMGLTDRALPPGGDPNRLRELYLAGSVATVAGELGVSRSQAHRLLVAAGVDMSEARAGAPRKVFDVGVAAERNAAGESLRDLAVEFGVGKSTLARRLQEYRAAQVG